MANITLMGASYTDVPAVDLPQTGGGFVRFYENGGGSSKNIQVYSDYDSVRSSSYTATDVTLTVAKTGHYNISWMGWRSTSSGTSGSQLYKNDSALGSADTTFTGNYGQHVTQSNVSLNKDDVLVVYARSRNSSNYMYVGNLIIEEV